MVEQFRADKLAEWWASIQNRWNEAYGHPWAPLMNLAGCEEKLDMPHESLPEAGFLEWDPGSLPDDASFKATTMDVLLALRKNLAERQNEQITLAWAEKLMRYCEIYNTSLKKRAIQKWGSLQETRSGMLHLASFLLDVYFDSRDIRFLNTTLKLMDKAWIFTASDTTRNLGKSGSPYTWALFQFRLSLMCACALEALNTEMGR